MDGFELFLAFAFKGLLVAAFISFRERRERDRWRRDNERAAAARLAAKDASRTL